MTRREEIARIIHPTAWGCWDADAGRREEEKTNKNNLLCISLAMADAILSLPPQEPVTSELVQRLREEADAMKAAVSGEVLHGTSHAMNWGDKPHRVLYDAVNSIREAASALSLQEAEIARYRNDYVHQNLLLDALARAETAEQERDEARQELADCRADLTDADRRYMALSAQKDQGQ